MRACLTSLLIGFVVVGISVGVGYLVVTQLRIGFCEQNLLRILLTIGLGGIAVFLLAGVLVALVNYELLGRGLSPLQIGVVTTGAAVLLMALAIILTYRQARLTCPSPGGGDELAQLCETALKSGSSGAAAAWPTSRPAWAISGLHPQASAWQVQAMATHRAVAASQAGVAVCLGEPVEETMEVCRFGGGIIVNRTQEQLPVTLALAPGGEIIGETTLQGDPLAECQPLGIQSLGKLHGRVRFDQLVDWLDTALAGPPATPTPLATATITPTRPPPTATLAPSPTPSPTPAMVALVKTRARMRSGPSTNDAIVTVLPTGTQLTVLGANSARDWLKVRMAEGIDGWISAELVELNGKVEDLPVVE